LKESQETINQLNKKVQDLDKKLAESEN